MAADPQLAAAARAMASGRPQEAYPLLSTRLKADPDDPVALRLMAALGLRAGRAREAVGMLMRTVNLAPDYETAWADLAAALHLLPPALALSAAEQGLATAPSSLGWRNLKGAMLERAGDFEGALAVFQAVVAERPDLADAWMVCGHLLKTLGRSDEAVAAYRRAMALRPRGGAPWWALADMKSFRFQPEEVSALRTLLARDDLADDDRELAAFALGRALELDGDHEASFAAYAEGNRLRRRPGARDVDQLAQERDAAARVFTPALFAGAEGGDPSPDPIFIVGLPRSGSTLVEQILASHPDVEGTMELEELPGVARDIAALGRARQTGYPDIVASLSGAERAAFGRAYLDRTRVLRRAGRARFIDKLPANFRHVGLLRLILPNARIVDVRRDPMACGLSIFKQYFAGGYGYAFDLADIGAYYRGYAAMMKLWDAVLPGHVHHLAYEALVADPEAEVRRLLAYLGLPFDPACLRFHETARAVRTPSGDQVRRPINGDALDAWRAYEPWLGPLRNALRQG